MYTRQEKLAVFEGGLNGAMQHQLEVYLQESQKENSFASVDSNGTPPLFRFD